MDFQFLFGNLGHRTSAFPLVRLVVTCTRPCLLPCAKLRESISGYKSTINIQGVPERTENWAVEELRLKIIPSGFTSRFVRLLPGVSLKIKKVYVILDEAKTLVLDFAKN